MQIDKSLVGHLADLSRLHFTDEEMVAMRADLEKMIGFVQKLNELDTSGIEPMMHMSQVQDVFRRDEAAEPMQLQKALENAGRHGEQFFTVPKVLG
jgi:aspartyl-tRNA(Asn)/glutamyl-tRNA(Gln) amidotransferase subunit C